MLTRTHPLARRLKALRGDAALRESEGVFVAEGIHLTKDALASRAAIEAAVVSVAISATAEGREIVSGLRGAGVETHEAPGALLDQLQDARSPQPVLLIVKREPLSLDAVVAGRSGVPLLVVACGVQEPGNLGALWRTADAAGATGFVATPGSASLTHPRTVRASAGAIFRLAAVEAGVGDVLEKVESSGLRAYGAEANGTPYDEVEWKTPVALFLGGEGAGLPEEIRARLDLAIGVPMSPGVESLSVHAAAAVLLFAAARARNR